MGFKSKIAGAAAVGVAFLGAKVAYESRYPGTSVTQSEQRAQDAEIRAAEKECYAKVSNAISEEYVELITLGETHEAADRVKFYGNPGGPGRPDEHFLIQRECDKTVKASFAAVLKPTVDRDARALTALGVDAYQKWKHPDPITPAEQTARRVSEVQKCDKEQIEASAAIVKRDPLQDVAEKKALVGELHRCAYKADALYPSIKAKVQYGPIQLK